MRTSSPGLSGLPWVLQMTSSGSSSVVQQSFGHAEHLLERGAQHRANPAGQLVGEARAAHLQHPQRAQLGCPVLLRVGEPPLRDRGDNGGHGDPFPLDRGEDSLRLGGGEHDHPAAGQQGTEDARAGERKVV